MTSLCLSKFKTKGLQNINKEVETAISDFFEAISWFSHLFERLHFTFPNLGKKEKIVISAGRNGVQE